MPSTHVWSNVESPGSPHFLAQAPPGAQQLRLPDCVIVPHLGQLLESVGVGVLVFVSKDTWTLWNDMTIYLFCLCILFGYIIHLKSSLATRGHCESIQSKTLVKQVVLSFIPLTGLNNHKRTFAGLDALEPRVIKVRVAAVSILLSPSTARGAAT